VVETSQGVAIQRKITLATRTVADLASQSTSLNGADVAGLEKAALAVLAPFPESPLNGSVSAVSIDANGIARVTWSDKIGSGKPQPVNSTVPLPAALVVPNSQLIWSELSYKYTPDFGGSMVGEINLSEQIYMRPRLSETVTRSSS
jgi:Flp pilus assembly protein TadG